MGAVRFVRTSGILTGAPPVYIKHNKTVIYVADKVIYACNCESNEQLYRISVHGDIITKLWTDSGKLFSCGLDGQIVISDIETGRVLSKVSVHKPVSRLVHNQDRYALLLERKNCKSICVFDASFKSGTRIFPEVDLDFLFDINGHFVAAISGTQLFLHWFEFGDYTCYNFPVDEKSTLKTFKNMTCVACHPKEAIVATGNTLGEIMIWWNLTSTSSNPFSEISEGDYDDDSTDEDDINCGHFHVIKKKAKSNWRPLHPKHVKRSGMHWHISTVTALAFTGEGKHLYSGGIEGVLVKWDLTECFGGVKNRRFISMLNSPIQEISSPGGHSGDCVVVLLEKNSFFVVNGAMQIIYKRIGLDQTPWRWRTPVAPRSFTPIALVLSEDVEPDAHSNQSTNNDDGASTSLILLSGALGSLQVIDASSAQVLSSINVNHQHYVMSDRAPSPLVSEALLADAWRGGEWLVTYSELQLPRRLESGSHCVDKIVDNQAQVVWWRRIPHHDQFVPASKFAYQAVFGESLAFLNSQATDLKFVRYPDGSQGFQALLITRDQRLLVWQHNPASDLLTSRRPWKLTSCIALNPSLLCLEREITQAAFCKVVILSDEEEPKDRLVSSREEALGASKERPRSVVICASGTSFTSFVWIRWQSGSSIVEDMVPLSTFQLSTWSEWKCSSVATEEVEICQLSVLDPAKRLCVALYRSLSSTSSQQYGPNGALCLLRVDPQGSFLPCVGVFDIAPTGAFAVHQASGLVAVGLINGSCVLYNSELQVMATSAQLPLLPFCDRAIEKRKRKRKRKSGVFTQPEALAFLSSASLKPFPPLAVLVSSRHGRSVGRRDLGVYDVQSPNPPTQNVSLRFEPESEPTGLLSRAERIHDDEVEEGGEKAIAPFLTANRRKRLLASDTEVVRTLRQVSQYPLDGAPTPEQLLTQIFKRPTL